MPQRKSLGGSREARSSSKIVPKCVPHLLGRSAIWGGLCRLQNIIGGARPLVGLLVEV